ncbi:MAG: hypothetical protein KF681_02650 [Bdellovibrionaceae bacterium]|nr:hypothetical protein [Pseudobdellovibrionaceae bacterium]
MILAGAFKIERSFARKIAIFFVIWLGVTSALVGSGLVLEHILPLAPLLFLSVNLCALIFALGPAGRKLATLPLVWLVAFQWFRLPLELVLHAWVGQDTIPATMSWEGQNFDVITGVMACLVLCKSLQTRAYYWLFNLVGFALLVNVMRVAMMSSPFPFSWPLDNPLQLIMHMPYAFIGTICVWGAFVGHLVLTRALLKK